MFESIVSDILVKSLGKYIELDASQLSLGVWSGDVELRDLVLRADALASLNLPIAIKYGTVGRLTLKVPWKSLRSSPVIVELSDVVLLVTPQDSAAFVYDEAKELASALKRKLDALDEAEAIKQMRSLSNTSDADASEKGFAAKLVTTIIGNIQVTVSSVHVRFEDRTAAGAPFALGLTIDSLTARSTDADWRLGVFIDPSVSPIMHKLVQLSSAALYLDAHSVQHLSALTDTAAIRTAMLALIARDQSPASLHQYVVAPMHAELRARINDKDNDLTVPKVRLEASLRMVDIELERQQYLDLLRVTESLSAYSVSIKNLKYRPRNGSRPFNDPRAWWRYAISVVMDDVRERVRRSSWAYMHTFRRQRTAYVALYKRTQHAHWLKPLTKPEQDALRKQEEELAYEDVLLFRAFATAELQSEKVRADAKLDEQRVERAKQSWFSRLTSSIKKASADDVKMSERERDELYASIGFDQALSQFELPHDYVQTTAQIAMNGFALVLRNGRDTLMRATLADVAANVQLRPDSMLLDASLQHLRVVDRYRDADRAIVLSAPYRPADNEPAALAAGAAAARAPLLSLQFEKAPLDGRADNALRLRMRPLDIIVDKPFLDRLGAFAVQETPVDLSNAKQRLEQTVEQVRANTRSRLEAAIATHATIDIDVEIEAPFVIVPEHATRPDAMALILDFGSLTVRSNLVDEKKDERDEDDYYDKFDVGIKSVKVLLAPLNTQWWRASVQDQLALRLVDDVALNVQLLQCIDQQEASLPQMRVRGSLERIAVNFSSSRYARLMRVAAVFETPPAIEGSVAPPPRAAVAASRAPKRAVPAITVGGADGDVKRKTKRKHQHKGAKVAAIAEATDISHDKSLQSIAARAAESRAAERQLLAKRVEMRAEFTIGELVMVVARDGTDIVAAAAQPMVRVRVERLAVRFEQLSYSMSASVALKEIAIDDLLQRTGGAEFSRLLSTTTLSSAAVLQSGVDDNASGALPAPTETNFVDIQYDAVTDKHPDYARVDSTVSIALSTLFVFVNRETVSELIRFGLIDLAQAGSSKVEAAAAAHRDAGGSLAVPTRARSGSVALADAVVSSLVGSLRLASPALAGTIEHALGLDADDDDDDDDDDDSDDSKSGSRIKRRRRVRTTMRLDLKVRQLGLVLNEEFGARQARQLAEFVISDIGVKLDMRSNETMRATGQLQSVTLADLVAKSAQERYWSILAPTDEAVSSGPMIEFAYDTYNKRRQRKSYPGWDAAARVRIASMRAVLLYAFVLRLQNYLVNGPILQALVASTAAKATSAASSVAAAAASNPVPNSRLKLDVGLKSFFVQVPESADSENLLLLDCGEGSIGNSFVDGNAESGIVETEHLRLDLQRVNLYNRKVVGGGDDLSAARRVERFQILRNFDVTIAVERVLDANEHSVPTMSVTINISRINFFLSELQYRAIMATLAGNLSPPIEASADDEPEPVVVDRSEQRKTREIAAQLRAPTAAPAGGDEVMHLRLPPPRIVVGDGDAADTKPATSTAAPAAAAASIWTNLKVVARLEQVGLALLTGEGIPVGQGEALRIDAIDGNAVPGSLASLAFNGLALNASMMSDNSLKASFQLQSIMLLDTRAASQNKFRRMFGPIAEIDGQLSLRHAASLAAISRTRHVDDNDDDDDNNASNSDGKAPAAAAPKLHHGSQAQIEVSFERNAAGDSVADVSVRQLRGFVVPSVLYAVQDFFMSVSAAPAAESMAAAKKAQQLQQLEAAPAPAAPVAAPAAVVPHARTPTMLAVVKIEQPQLFVLEDETSSESSAVELCIGAISVEFAIDEHAKQAATVLVDDFEVFVTHPQRKQTADESDHVPLVRQFDMKLDYVSWRKQADDALVTQSIAVDIDPIIMLFSYQDALMMMKIAGTLTPPAKPAESAAAAAAKEAAAIAASLVEPDEEREAREAFMRFDEDGSGLIDIVEFRKVLHAIGKSATRAEADVLFRSVDTDGSGSVNFNEFMTWWLSAGVAFLDSESDSEVDNADDDDDGAAASDSKARAAANMRLSKDAAAAAAAGSAPAGDERANNAVVVPDTRAFEQAVVKCHSLTLTLINDFQGRAQPFAEVRVLNLDLEAKGWSSPFSQVALGMTLTADYFNPRVMMFEPVLEYWTFRIGQIGGGGDETKPATRLALQSDQRLELNVSHAMIDTMLTAYSHFATSLQAQKEPQLAVAGAVAASAAPLFSPYWLENHTGCPLHYAASADRDAGSGGPRGKRVATQREFVALPVGARVPVSFGDFNAKLDTLGTHSLAIRFRADGRAIESIPMDSVGVMRFTHPDAQLRDLTGGASLAPEAADVVCLVSEHDGSKTITLRSLVELHNGTGDAQSGVPLRVVFRAPEGSDVGEGGAANAECVLRLEPGATASVPLAAVHSGVLFVQPDLGAAAAQFDECGANDALHMRSLDRLLGRTFVVSCPLRGVAAAVGGAGDAAPPALYLRVTPSRQVQSTSNAMRDLLRVTFAAPVNVRNGLPGAVEYLVSDGALTAAAAAERDASLPPLLVGRRTIESGAVGSFFGFPPRKSVSVSLRGGVLGWSDDHDPSKLVVKPALLALEEEKWKKSEATMELRNSATNKSLALQAIAVADDEGVLCARVFAPYALVDRTRLFLSFRQSGFNDNGVMLPLTAARRDAPFLFSFPHSTLFEGKLCLKSTSAAEWSSAFSLDAVGGRANAEARGAPGERDTCVRHSIALGTDALADTKVVTFTYAYVLVNEHDRPIWMQQVIDGDVAPLANNKHAIRLAPGERAAFHWLRAENARRLLQCRFDEDGSLWSGSFAIDDLDEFPIRVRSSHSVAGGASRDSFAQVRVSDGGGSTVVQLLKYDAQLPPFCIENDTDATLHYYQKGCEALSAPLPPRSRLDFMWDVPSGEHELVIEVPREGAKGRAPTFSYSFAKIRAFRPIKVGGGGVPAVPRKRAFVFVRALGPTRSLCITHNSYKLRRCVDLNKVEDESRIALRSERERVSQEIVVELAGIGVSIVDSRPIEMLYVTLHQLEVSLQQTSLSQKLEFRVSRFQIDNQLYSTPFSVMLAPNLQNKRARGKPFFHLSVVKSSAYTSIDYYNYASFLVQEFDVRVEDSWLFILLQFANSLPLDKLASAVAPPPTLIELAARARAADLAHAIDYYLCDDSALGLTSGVSAAAAPVAARKIYFELLHLNPIKVNLSFQMIKGVGAFVDNPLLRTVLQTLVKTVANLDNAPLRFNALVLESVFSSQTTLQSQIVAHYRSQGLREALKVVGSADVLGNPVGLFTSLSTGVTDFFYEPAEGIVESPAAFGRGLATGTLSLLKNTIYGSFNTVSKLTAAMDKGVATLSLDDKYIAERKARAQYKPRHAADGVFEGTKDLARGVFDGITGIVLKPVEGAIEGGVVGFGKGLAKGLIGAAVKPVGGVLAFAAKTTAGIKNTTTLFDDRATRQRFARAFVHRQVLEPYDAAAAEGAALLYALDGGAHRFEQYNFHRAVGRTVMLVSDSAIYLSKSALEKTSAADAAAATKSRERDKQTSGLLGVAGLRVNQSASSLWRASLAHVIALELAPHTVVLRVTDTDDDQIPRDIECPDDSVALLVYTKLSAVVKSYAAEHAADLARARAKLAELGRAKTAAKAEEERGMQRRPSVVAKLVEPRAKSDWVPDSAAKECQVCKAKFTFVKRKHHCRICARVLCNACTSKRARARDGDQVRVCDECFDNLPSVAKIAHP